MGHSLKNLNLVETEFFTKQIAQKFVESIEVLAPRFERGGGKLESSKMSGQKGLSSSEIRVATSAVANPEQTLLIQPQLELLELEVTVVF